MNKRPACFSTKISLEWKDKLQQDLEEKGFAISKPPYTIFSAVKKGVSCTLYQSGSLTVQGKDKDAFIEFYLEPEILQNLSYTYPMQDVDKARRIGCDEAGKGDYFGPIVAACVYADEKKISRLVELGVKDSKTYSDAKSLSLAKTIQELCPFEIVRLMPPKYNELYAKFGNLNYLLAWMHTTGLKSLALKTKCEKAILDQFAHPSLMEKSLERAKLSIDLEQKVRAEQDVVVAAASILARASFLSSLSSLEEKYGLLLPKGASKKVLLAGQKIVEKFGIATLDAVSKTHFKTRSQIVS